MEKKEKTETSKVIVFGVDGATFDIIDPMIKEGKLPNLKKLMGSGTRGCLTSTLPPLSAVAWTSMVTGVNPGKHGIFDFLFNKEGSYNFVPLNASFRRAKAIWKIISDNGGDVGVMNIPMTYPAEKVNGFMIAGLDSPKVKSEFTFEPHDLYDELIREVGNYAINQDVIINSDPENPRFFKALTDIIDIQGKALKYLLQNKEWNLFFYVLTITDFIQHSCWKYMDKNHPEYKEELHKKFGDYIFRIYEKMDDLLGEVIALTDPDTSILIVSDHGQGPLFKNFSINNWLRKEGYFHLKEDSEKGLTYHAVKALRNISNNIIIPVGQRAGSDTFQKIMTRFLKFATAKISSYYMNNVDWARTKVFCEGSYPAIFINTKGKYPDGNVSPGKEYEEMRSEIIEKMSLIKDPETGRHIVRAVHKPEDIYTGDSSVDAPDLICILEDGYHGSGELQQIYMGIDSEQLFAGHRWSGNHTMDGVVVASGPGIKKGATISDARIIDVTPTLLYLLGLPVPEEMDGKVLDELFTEDYLNSHEKKFSKESQMESHEAQPFTDEESELVRERLRDIGYIE